MKKATGTVAYDVTDREGSVRALTDNTGTVQDRITYDAFANVLTESNTSFGDWYKGFGYRFDAAIGDDLDGIRYLYGLDGRYVTPAPMGFGAGDPNLYRYVMNDPTNMTDPTGMIVGGDDAALLIAIGVGVGVFLSEVVFNSSSVNAPGPDEPIKGTPIGNGVVDGFRGAMLGKALTNPTVREYYGVGMSFDFASQKAGQADDWYQNRPIRPFNTTSVFDNGSVFAIGGPPIARSQLAQIGLGGLGLYNAKEHYQAGEPFSGTLDGVSGT